MLNELLATCEKMKVPGRKAKSKSTVTWIL